MDGRCRQRDLSQHDHFIYFDERNTLFAGRSGLYAILALPFGNLHQQHILALTTDQGVGFSQIECWHEHTPFYLFSVSATWRRACEPRPYLSTLLFTSFSARATAVLLPAGRAAAGYNWDSERRVRRRGVAVASGGPRPGMPGRWRLSSWLATAA